jgi:hypothetical protein
VFVSYKTGHKCKCVPLAVEVGQNPRYASPSGRFIPGVGGGGGRPVTCKFNIADIKLYIYLFICYLYFCIYFLYLYVYYHTSVLGLQ